MNTYEIRYDGEYGNTLYGRYVDLDAAKVALHTAQLCARAWGASKLLATLHIC
jgi:hypothetical protein